VREPIDLVVSWWRYRSRPALDGIPRSTKGVSLDQWAEQVMAGRGGFRRPSAWATDARGRPLLDRTWKYEHLEAAADWMASKCGRRIDLPHLNPSPPRPPELSPGVVRRLEEFLQPEYDLYRAAL